MPMIGIIVYAIVRSSWVQPRYNRPEYNARQTRRNENVVNQGSQYCTNCGFENALTASYCNKCGSEIYNKIG